MIRTGVPQKSQITVDTIDCFFDLVSCMALVKFPDGIIEISDGAITWIDSSRFDNRTSEVGTLFVMFDIEFIWMQLDM